jgi:hypothetical protein
MLSLRAAVRKTFTLVAGDVAEGAAARGVITVA